MNKIRGMIQLWEILEVKFVNEFSFLIKFPIIVLLRQQAMEQLWTAEDTNKTVGVFREGRSLSMQQTFPKYHEHICVIG
jgi:hypothetical protein